MIDAVHSNIIGSEAQGKYSGLIFPFLAIFSITDLTITDFFLITLTWLIKIIIATFAGIGIYEYFMDQKRYKQWAKGGYKIEDKPKYKIK